MWLLRAPAVTARLETDFLAPVPIGTSEVVSKKDFSFARTRGADPAAYYATTFWISQGIKVKVADERDPTPYWLISTRKAKELIAALEAE